MPPLSKPHRSPRPAVAAADRAVGPVVSGLAHRPARQIFPMCADLRRRPRSPDPPQHGRFENRAPHRVSRRRRCRPEHRWSWSTAALPAHRRPTTLGPGAPPLRVHRTSSRGRCRRRLAALGLLPAAARPGLVPVPRRSAVAPAARPQPSPRHCTRNQVVAGHTAAEICRRPLDFRPHAATPAPRTRESRPVTGPGPPWRWRVRPADARPVRYEASAPPAGSGPFRIAMQSRHETA